MINFKKGAAIGLVTLIALIGSNEPVNAQTLEVKTEIEYSIKHSQIKEVGIDIEKIISKIPDLNNKTGIELLIEKEQELERKSKLSSEEIARLVINGEYGNGEERRQKLTEEGRNFEEIQNEVEKITYEANKEVKNREHSVNQVSKAGISKGNKAQQVVQSTQSSSGKKMTMEATAYSTAQPSLSRYTANGTDLLANPRVVAVDPKVIPLGTMVTVEGYGTYVAADTGGNIKGNRIDIHFSTVQECKNFGRRNVTLTIHN